jgi:chitinase
VTVHYTTSAGTATDGADYTAVNDTFSFAPGQVAKTVAVPILDDGLPEPAEDFALSLSGATGGATIGDGTARIVIGPSDAAATAQPFVLAQPDVVVGESDGLVNLAVSLSAPGLDPVSLDWILDDGTATGGTACDKDYASDRDHITFLPGETPRSCTCRSSTVRSLRASRRSLSISSTTASSAKAARW